uniref:G_PROTEIN_RECEP_F1_2 domain-containing protein n=1 Tax=Meloidogyne hapla TaxID=6305 RepID=A0A1I8B4I8_MELHA
MFFISVDRLIALAFPILPTYCEPGDQSVGDALSKTFNLNITLILLTIIVYIILGCLVKFCKNEHNEAIQTQKIYKSLAIIITSIVLLDFIGMFAIKMITPLLSEDPQTRFLYFRLFAQLITVSGAINAPILYFYSTLYRTTFNKQFPFIPVLINKVGIKQGNNISTVKPSKQVVKPMCEIK